MTPPRRNNERKEWGSTRNERKRTHGEPDNRKQGQTDKHDNEREEGGETDNER